MEQNVQTWRERGERAETTESTELAAIVASVLAVLPAAAFFAEPFGAIVYGNAMWRELVGVSDGEVARWPWDSLVHRTESNAWLESWREAVATQQPIAATLRLKIPGVQQYRRVLLRATPLRSAGGGITGRIGIAMSLDDAEAVRAEQMDSIAEMDHLLRRFRVAIDAARVAATALSAPRSDPQPASPLLEAEHLRLSQLTLSDREVAILKLVALGCSNAEIAERLHFSLGTIKLHVRDLQEKLEARDRTAAAVKALRLGFIT